MAKRIPKHIMYDKVGEIRRNEKAISPKGKNRSSSQEHQSRLVSQFMATAKNSNKPSEATLLEKLVVASRKRKKIYKEEQKMFAKGINMNDKMIESHKNENSKKLKSFLKKNKNG